MQKNFVNAFSALTVTLLLFSACTLIPAVPPVPSTPVTPPAATPLPEPAYALASAIGWDSAGHQAWSQLVAQMIDKEFFQGFDTAVDAKRVCPKYAALSREQRVTVWTEFVSAIAYYESGWKPTSRMKETGLGVDPITGAQVWSEGLLQLSYQDMPNYRDRGLNSTNCGISWSRDKTLAPADPKKTILDPVINLQCGVRILAYQVRTGGTAIKQTTGYWSVLREQGQYSQVPGILKKTNSLAFCK